METSFCAHCGKTYVDKNSQGVMTRRVQWPDGKPFWYPACDCRERLQATKDYAEAMESRIQAVFDRTGLGQVRNIYETIPDIGYPWNDAKVGLAEGRNLVLIGAVGSGKTTVLKHIVRDLTKAMVPVRGGYVPTLMSSLKQMDSVDEILASIENGRVLVLDDLDKILGTVYEIEKLSSVVNVCIQKERPVLVTTNLDLPELKRLLCSNKYGVPENWVESFLSRLRGGAQVVKFSGKDFRSAGEFTQVNV